MLPIMEIPLVREGFRIPYTFLWQCEINSFVASFLKLSKKNRVIMKVQEGFWFVFVDGGVGFFCCCFVLYKISRGIQLKP